MANLVKSKTVENSGKITVTKTEERYPCAANILMCHGFGIICLNMVMGLLPITVWGTRMKYFKLSISQLYTVVFFICFIILSVIFVPVQFFPKSDEPKTMTNFVILIALGIAHVVGYILLLIRGHYVAYKIPALWAQLCKLVQISVIDVYGKNCYLLKQVTSFGLWAVGEFVGAVITSMGSIVIWSAEYSGIFEESFKYYNLHYVVIPGHVTSFQMFQVITYKIGFFIWQMCSFSHVLVSMLLCYFVIVIRICLQSVNQQIQEFVTKVDKKHWTNLRDPKIRFKRDDFVEGLKQSSLLSSFEQVKVIRGLDRIKNIMLIIEQLLETISAVWGVSLVVEALILIASGTVNTFNFFSEFQELQQQDSMQGARSSTMTSFKIPNEDYWIDLLVTVTIHFYFLFKLSCQVNKMTTESKTSLQLLKQASYYDLPRGIQEKIQMLKHDLTSTSVSLSAANYFHINKFLITSITSQVATYLIVLLQFAQQEIASSQKLQNRTTT